MKTLIFTLSLLLFLSCNNNQTESSNTTDNTSTAPNVINEQASDTSMRRNKSLLLTEASQKMMREMKAMTSTGSVDNDFAMMMIIHHQGAIDMSKAQLNEGIDSSLKQLAQQIDSASRKEIAELDSFLTRNKPLQKAAPSDFASKAMQLMDSSAMNKMTMSGNLDDDYSEMMIHHHQDGIAMSKQYLKSGKASATRKIAENIIRQQPKEIQKLKEINDRVK